MSTDPRRAARSQDRQVVQYLMPSDPNMRTVFVDNSTTPVRFGVGSITTTGSSKWSARLSRGVHVQSPETSRSGQCTFVIALTNITLKRRACTVGSVRKPLIFRG